MSHVLHSWLFMGCNAYIACTFVSSLNKSAYRRTMAFSKVRRQ